MPSPAQGPPILPLPTPFPRSPEVSLSPEFVSVKVLSPCQAPPLAGLQRNPPASSPTWPTSGQIHTFLPTLPSLNGVWFVPSPALCLLSALCSLLRASKVLGRLGSLSITDNRETPQTEWSSWSRPRSWEVKAPGAASASKEIASQIPLFPLWACPLTAWERVPPNRVSVTQGEISLGHLDILHLSFYLLHLGPSIKTSNLTTSYVSSVQGASPGQCSGSGQVQSPDGSME